MEQTTGLSGLFLTDKQAGPSSAQTLHHLKKNLNLGRDIKLGHAGTLDPFATGLLIVLLGKATRLADLFQAQFKTYSGKIKLGVITDSDDITGQVISESEVKCEFSQIQECAESFVGEYEQLPPAISALKVSGRRAYELARAGEKPDLKSRKVSLESMDLFPLDKDLIGFRISCSKGFYVRALARDIGQKSGCGACLLELRREESGPFSVLSAKKTEDLQLADLISLDQALKLLKMQEILVDEINYNKLKQGLINGVFQSEILAKLDFEGQGLLAYRRETDLSLGGLLRACEGTLSIHLNF